MRISTTNIYAIDPQTGADRKIVNAVGVAFSPAWSPDGNSIAYLATTRKATTIDSIAEDTHVWVIGRDGGAGKIHQRQTGSTGEFPNLVI